MPETTHEDMIIEPKTEHEIEEGKFFMALYFWSKKVQTSDMANYCLLLFSIFIFELERKQPRHYGLLKKTVKQTSCFAFGNAQILLSL